MGVISFRSVEEKVIEDKEYKGVGGRGVIYFFVEVVLYRIMVGFRWEVWSFFSNWGGECGILNGGRDREVVVFYRKN